MSLFKMAVTFVPTVRVLSDVPDSELEPLNVIVDSPDPLKSLYMMRAPGTSIPAVVP